MRSSFKLSPIDVAQALLPAQNHVYNHPRGPQASSPASKALKGRAVRALLLCSSMLGCAASLSAQVAPPLARPTPEAAKPSISLSPAVIMAKGNFGQELTQTLTLTNQSGLDLAFDLVAEDVVIKEGKRVFVPAGETPNSIAATAVFSQKTVMIKAFSSGTVDVRLTIPAETNIRAIVAMFRGTDKIPTSSSAVGMTASLGTLITFNLTDRMKLQPETVRVNSATDTANMSIAQWIANNGDEPALPEGTAAILNAGGSLVGKATFPAQRLLPGERLEFSAEYPAELAPGKYRVLCSYQFDGKTLTSEGSFEVPKR
jgi:hypothetical protein